MYKNKLNLYNYEIFNENLLKNLFYAEIAQ